MWSRTGGAVRRSAPAAATGFAPFRLALLGRRRLAIAFNEHATPFSIGEDACPRLFGRALLPSLLIAPAAAKFAVQLFARLLRPMCAPRMRRRLSVGCLAIFLFVRRSLIPRRARTSRSLSLISWGCFFRLALRARDDRRGEIRARKRGDAFTQLLAQHAGTHLFHFAFAKFTKLKRAERDADQAGDGEAQVAEHIAHLAVLALADGEGEPQVGALHAIKRCFDRAVVDAVDGDTRA